MSKELSNLSEILNAIFVLFSSCKNHEKFLVDKNIINSLKSSDSLNKKLLEFSQSQNFDLESVILFNWFISITFGVCINEMGVNMNEIREESFEKNLRQKRS